MAVISGVLSRGLGGFDAVLRRCDVAGRARSVRLTRDFDAGNRSGPGRQKGGETRLATRRVGSEAQSARMEAHPRQAEA